VQEVVAKIHAVCGERDQTDAVVLDAIARWERRGGLRPGEYGVTQRRDESPTVTPQLDTVLEEVYEEVIADRWHPPSVHAPLWVQAVTLDAIADQRARNWPDFHPEDFCHRCGHRNAYSWAVHNDYWEAIPVEQRPTSDIMCISCFDTLFRAVTGMDIHWELSTHTVIKRAPEPEEEDRP
jgi:hypothetical protein